MDPHIRLAVDPRWRRDFPHHGATWLRLDDEDGSTVRGVIMRCDKLDPKTTGPVPAGMFYKWRVLRRGEVVGEDFVRTLEDALAQANVCYDTTDALYRLGVPLPMPPLL